MTDYSQNQVIRIPNLPVGQMVDSTGSPTTDELTFRQTLISNLQKYFGNEGIVIPVQDAVSVALIQNNSVIDTGSGLPVYTCQLGTMLYQLDPIDYTQDKVLIAVRNDNTYPATPPIFKVVTLT